MNQHMPAGQGHQQYPTGPHMNSHHNQRPREFHPYHIPPQSPMHQYPYQPNYPPHPQQYYHPQPYQHQNRWQHQQPPSPYGGPHYMPPPHSPVHNIPYQQRSPMVVSSQPMYNQQPHVPNARYPPMPYEFRPNQMYPPYQNNNQLKDDGRNGRTVELDAGNSSGQSTTPLAAEPDVQLNGDAASAETVTANSRLDKDSAPTNPLQSSPVLRTPFYPELPWYSPSTSASSFPSRDLSQRKPRSVSLSSTNAVTLPSRHVFTADTSTSEPLKQSKTTDDGGSEVSTLAAPSDAETPATSHAPSESECTNVSTPTTPAQLPETSPKPTPTQTPRRDPRASIAVPFIPGLPRHKTAAERQSPGVASPGETAVPLAASASIQGDEQTQADEEEVQEPVKAAPPKSWADLVRKNQVTNAAVPTAQLTNGASSIRKNATLAEALRQYTVQPGRVTFFEPRGLVNTGNMCYMNSILQVLVFCVPFYDFLDQVRSRTVHSIKSDTPLLDAMIMFMRDLPVLAAAPSVDQLRSSIKPEQLEQYGESITPEYIYDAIKHLPRFQSMRRGHQQDAEEFLGFVLEGLHDECIAVMQSGETPAYAIDDGPKQESTDANGWLEVGPKQKSAVTRTAGQEDTPSPVTKIFGGHLRSELRVSGQKDSVTLEPYKPLQLDIGAAHIHNISDAIKSITRPESLTGDFGGRANTAKKQVFIDSVPPVLILHLKRFQYENNLTGTQKIWKKVGYPLELEMPKDVFSPAKRGALTVSGGLPKYRLTAVVYHHGKSAAGGHYTVDVLRQDFQEWVRIDDTIIRRIRAEDVAEGGAEEDPKVLARALEQHKAAQEMQKQRNMYEGLDESDQTDEHAQPWSEVNGGTEKKVKPATAVPTGVATPSSTAGKRTPNARKEGVRDNKVAYILLYERV